MRLAKEKPKRQRHYGLRTYTVPKPMPYYWHNGDPSFLPFDRFKLSTIELGERCATHKDRERYNMQLTTDTFGMGRGRSAVEIDFPILEVLKTEGSVTLPDGETVTLDDLAVFIRKGYVMLSHGEDWTSPNGVKSYASAKRQLVDVITDLFGLDDTERVSVTDQYHKKTPGTIGVLIRKA